jgi:hypothetical protein
VLTSRLLLLDPMPTTLIKSVALSMVGRCKRSVPTSCAPLSGTAPTLGSFIRTVDFKYSKLIKHRTYLGYKLLQTGSYDPNLCTAACDAQTAYNEAHPPSNGPAVDCTAIGSYIATVTNSTGSYQMGQMCTMYTANWDKQFATGTADYNDAIGAKYTYSQSFFYGKNNAQPVCPSAGFTSSSTPPTFIKGGVDPSSVSSSSSASTPSATATATGS